MWTIYVHHEKVIALRIVIWDNIIPFQKTNFGSK